MRRDKSKSWGNLRVMQRPGTGGCSLGIYPYDGQGHRVWCDVSQEELAELIERLQLMLAAGDNATDVVWQRTLDARSRYDMEHEPAKRKSVGK